MMAKPWDEHRQVIVRLYIKEGRTLHDVRTIMKAKHGFEASVRSYRQHFDQWRVGKYNCKKRQQRRRESTHSTRKLLPSPPRTPVTGAASVAGSTSEAGTLEARSPASVASMTQTSGCGDELPSPPAQQRQQQQPFVPRFFGPTSAQELAVQDRSSTSPKGINVMAPATGGWRDEDIQVMLRSSSMAEGMHSCFNPSTSSAPSAQKPQSMTRPATNASLALDTRCGVEPAKLPVKYMQQPVSTAGGWEMARPMTTTAAVAAAAFQLSGPQAEFYRIPCQDRMPGMFTLNSMTRSHEYQPAQRSPGGAFPQIIQGRMGGHVGRDRNVPHRQLTNGQMSFDRLTS